MADPRDLESVRRLLRDKKDEIRGRFKSVGVGVGKHPSGGYAIVVYLESARDKPPEPVEIDGVPLIFKVTGRFEIQTETAR